MKRGWRYGGRGKRSKATYYHTVCQSECSVNHRLASVCVWVGVYEG